MYEIIAAWCLHAKLFDRSTAGRPHTPSRLCLMPDLHGRVDRFAHVRAARMAWIALDSTRPASLDYCHARYVPAPSSRAVMGNRGGFGSSELFP
jgi:hypothetical protein